MAEWSRDELLKRVRAGESLERVDLRDIQLEGVSLVGANLARADLTGANLSRADLRKAILSNACLREAFLQGANLDEANLRNADLDGGKFAGASFEGADASRANFEGANLEGAKLTKARLQNASFSDANLGKAELVEANLRVADFTDAYLGGANLLGADLRRAILDGANFEEADLRGVDLRECEISSAILEKAMLDGAKVYGLGITSDQLRQLVVQWWDVSRGGDGSLREEGTRVGDFLKAVVEPVAVPIPVPTAPAEVATRFFGEGDVLRNAELEFSAGSIVEVRGRFEDCRIRLGEDARITIGQTGVLRDCAISGQGHVLIHGRLINNGKKALTSSKVFIVGAAGTAVGTVKQPEGCTRFAFEPGCILRLTITT